MTEPRYKRVNALHRKPKKVGKVAKYGGNTSSLRYGTGALGVHTSGGVGKLAKYCSICGSKLPKAEKDRIGGTCKNCLNSPGPSARRREILGI